jgi:hypothetical protein
MTGAIFLIGAALFGMGLVRRLFTPALNQAEQTFWGLVIGWSVATGVAYGFARTLGSLGSPTTLFAILFVWLGALLIWQPTIQRLSREAMKLKPLAWDKSYTPLAVLLCLFTPIYLGLFVTHMLQVKADGGIYSGGESTYYDMAYHAAITTSFVHGANFPPIYTPMPPTPLLYPFLPDFLTALLMIMGMSLHSALVATAVPLCLALTGLFYFLALRLVTLAGSLPGLRATWAAAIATFLFLLNGGIGFVYFFQRWDLSVNYTHLPDKGLVWPNVITDMLLPQRTSIFGLSLGLIILSCFALSWERAAKKWRDWPTLIVAGVLAGLLPYFHVHSYVAVGLISGALFLLRPRRAWLCFWLPAIMIALPRLLEFSGSLASTGFVRFQPGWRGQSEPSWLLFWLRNIGLPALLIIPAWISARRSLRLFYLPFLLLLVLSLLVVFSPNDYDNLKLMIYWYAATAVVIGAWLVRIARKPVGVICCIALIVASTFSGALAITAESRSSRLMFGSAERNAAEFVKANTRPHSLFLTAPSLHHPILSLAGRRVVRGPTAWLWSHGYRFAAREADVRAIYAGRDDALDLLRYYRVDYVYVGPHEIEELRANRAFFDAILPDAYRSGAIAIYDARKLRRENGAAFWDYPPREYAARVDRDPSQVLEEFDTVACDLYFLHERAFGRMPRYQEFVSDLKKLGKDLYLHQPGWEEMLAHNKKLLADELTTRPGFKERMSEDRRRSPREYDAAFVLCHYFAYLKRNPDEAPDHDLTGYHFWLAQLERTHDYRGVTRAFLESDEYKQREP